MKLKLLCIVIYFYMLSLSSKKLVNKFLKKSLFCALAGINAVACTNLVPTPLSPSEAIPEEQAIRIGGKPSTRPPTNSNDNGLVVTPDTLKTTLVRSDLGQQVFDFYPITSPDINFSFPSHSVVMMPVSYVGIEQGIANSFCEYWLYTKSGELVCYCKNTVSGLHPVYGNSFNANNHLPDFTKKIAYGEYRLVYKNISTDPVKQTLIFGLIANYGKDQVDTYVLSGETKEFWIKIYPSTSEFKMNNNNKEPI